MPLLSRCLRRHSLALLFAALPVSQAAFAGQVADRVRQSATLRVCIWPDYFGISFRDPRSQRLAGIDVDLSAEFARDLGVKLQYVDSSFVRLVEDLDSDRRDVAMFAVGVTEQRAQRLKFSQPYLKSGIYGVTTRNNRLIKSWDDIDQSGVRVAVQAGTFMEPVMAQALKRATLVVVRPPQTREQELEAGRIDVFMTDYPYSRRLLENADWARLVPPPRSFHTIPYAYAVKPGDAQWLTLLDDFVERVKRDGRLATAARKFGLQDIAIAR